MVPMLLLELQNQAEVNSVENNGGDLLSCALGLKVEHNNMDVVFGLLSIFSTYRMKLN